MSYSNQHRLIVENAAGPPAILNLSLFNARIWKIWQKSGDPNFVYIQNINHTLDSGIYNHRTRIIFTLVLGGAWQEKGSITSRVIFIFIFGVVLEDAF